MAKRSFLAAVVLLICLGGATLSGNWVPWSHAQKVCSICNRHINPRAHAIAEVGDRRLSVCCARCALTEGQQEHTSVRLIAVTDYLSGRELDPQRAWFVEGSRVAACTHAMDRIGEAKRADQLAFDRCDPSTLAFSRREDAETFIAQNGGVVRSLDLMMRSFQKQPATPKPGQQRD